MLALSAFRKYVVVNTSIIALSNHKKTAKEAESTCSAYGGSLAQINNADFTRNMLIEEYVDGEA